MGAKWKSKEKLPADHWWHSHKSKKYTCHCFVFGISLRQMSTPEQNERKLRSFISSVKSETDTQGDNIESIHGDLEVERRVIVIFTKKLCLSVHNLKIVRTNRLSHKIFIWEFFAHVHFTVKPHLPAFTHSRVSYFWVFGFAFCQCFQDHDGIELHHHLTKFQFQLLKHIISSWIQYGHIHQQWKKRTCLKRHAPLAVILIVIVHIWNCGSKLSEHWVWVFEHCLRSNLWRVHILLCSKTENLQSCQWCWEFHNATVSVSAFVRAHIHTHTRHTYQNPATYVRDPNVTMVSNSCSEFEIILSPVSN